MARICDNCKKEFKENEDWSEIRIIVSYSDTLNDAGKSDFEKELELCDDCIKIKDITLFGVKDFNK